MIGILPIKTKTKIVNSLHFWLVIVITLFLIFIYQAWPWKDWKFTLGIWQWFPWLSPLYKLAVVEFTNHFVGILFLVPIIYAAVVCTWQIALVVCLLSLVGVLPIVADIWSINFLIINMALLLLPFLVVSIIFLELGWHRKEKAILAEREEQRRIYLSKVLEVQENERQRIAQELHDDTTQRLLVIANRAQVLVSSGDDDVREIQRNAEWIRDMSLETAKNIRGICLGLRPSILDDLGLVPALRWLIDHMNRESDINTQILVNSEEHKLSLGTEVTIFRVVQEALNNIRHHSQANEAFVTLDFGAKSLKITIKDNGQGFHPPKELGKLATKGKLGLIGIQERIASLDGKFEIRSRPSKGTLLLIEVKY